MNATTKPAVGAQRAAVALAAMVGEAAAVALAATVVAAAKAAVAARAAAPVMVAVEMAAATGERAVAETQVATYPTGRNSRISKVRTGVPTRTTKDYTRSEAPVPIHGFRLATKLECSITHRQAALTLTR